MASKMVATIRPKEGPSLALSGSTREALQWCSAEQEPLHFPAFELYFELPNPADWIAVDSVADSIVGRSSDRPFFSLCDQGEANVALSHGRKARNNNRLGIEVSVMMVVIPHSVFGVTC